MRREERRRKKKRYEKFNENHVGEDKKIIHQSINLF